MDYGALNSHPTLIYLHHNMAQISIHHIPIHESIHRHRCLPVAATATALLLLLLLQATTATPANRSFTVELIHQYSKRSPLYGNLTQSQLLKRLVESSRSRLQWLESSTSHGGGTADTNAIRPLLKVDRLIYLVPVRIGTGQGMRPYHLAFDTGSSLTWTPCEPCESCFDQRGQRFDPAQSPTYSPLPHADRLCDKPDGNGRCTFRVDYADGSFTQGILSRDTFTFPSDSRGHDEPVGGVVFGCAHSAAMDRHVRNRIDGVMGMGMAPASLPTQLHRVIDGHFSYCLVPPGTQTAGFLRFGRNHVHPRGPLEATPITRYSKHGHYHLQLEGVSINGRRLNLPPETFALHDDDHGGCIIDTGFPTSVLIKAAYDEASNVLREHFQHLRRVDGKAKGHSLELCYETPRKYASVLPHMTLHFRWADYHIGNEKLFTVNHQEGFFCWSMHRSDQFTVLGAYQQYNVRFLYDIQSRMLSFGPENCALESAGH